MTRRLVPASLLLVALLLAACSSTSSSSSTTTTKPPTTTTKPTTKPTTTTAAVANAAACTTKSLAISIGQAQGAAGHNYVPIVFQNTGSVPCTLAGFPGVALTTTGGQQAVQAARTSATATTITLQPHGFGSALLTATDVPSGTQTTCPSYAGVLVTPPNDTGSQALSVQVPGCSTPTISPVVTGNSGQ